ncbi:MAG: SurA N-terminal domain-containing protein [Burkholderiales bacterium]|nr:SurA N-terminal domain-containing protein [Burkholderiales bacterium]
MFDFVRKHTKIMMFLMFLLIIPAFVLVGVDGYRRMNGGGEAVAKVGSHGITQAEWDAAHKNETDRLRASMPNVDPKLLDSAEARYVTLERLVRERVMADAAQGAHLITTDARLARELQQNPTIASLRKPDGTMDMERYRQLAASQGLTPEGFEARVRNDLSMQQVETGIKDTAFATAAQAAAALNAFYERREVQVVRFAAADYAGKVTPSDADIEAFYQANQAMFQAPEVANVEYVVLDLDSVKKTISINEQDLKSYYEQNAARLSGKEERRASHILLNAPKDMPVAERQKVKDRATALLAQLRKAPETFAEVARKNSQDTGSAANGGDLDFFGRGAMVKPFEEAVFAMKKGDISDVVESDFGFHIIKLTDVKAPKQKSFDELRVGMEADLRTQQAQRKFAEVAVEFTNGVYEQSDALKPIADKLKLEVKTFANLQRNTAPAQAGVLANPKLLAAIFSADSVEKKRNTEAIEIGANQLAAARITQYTAARTLPLAEVKVAVRDRLVASRAAEMAKKEGQEKLEAWKANAAGASLPAAVVVSREQTQNIPAPVITAALRADTTSLPAWVGVDLGAQGYAVVRINKVLERPPVAEATLNQERDQVAQWLAGAEVQAYYQSLKDQYKVQIKVAKPNSAVPHPQ